MSKTEKAVTFVQAALSQEVATVRELVDGGSIITRLFPGV